LGDGNGGEDGECVNGDVVEDSNGVEDINGADGDSDLN